MFAWRHSIYLRLHLYIAVCIFLLMCDSFLRSWFIAIDCFLAVYICFVACLEFATLEIVIFLAMCLAFFCLLSLRSLFAACVYSPILVCVAHLISICLSFTNITGVILPIELLQLLLLACSLYLFIVVSYSLHLSIVLYFRFAQIIWHCQILVYSYLLFGWLFSVYLCFSFISYCCLLVFCHYYPCLLAYRILCILALRVYFLMFSCILSFIYLLLYACCLHAVHIYLPMFYCICRTLFACGLFCLL